MGQRLHGCDGIDIESRGIAGKDSAWFCDLIKRMENLLLDIHVFKNRLDDQIRILKSIIG